MLELLVITTMCIGLLIWLLPAKVTAIKWVPYTAWALAIFSLTLLLPQGASLRLSFEWIPRHGVSGLELGPPTTYLVLGVFWSMALACTWKQNDAQSDPRLCPSLVFISCSLLVISLTLNHFLTRYAILELVVLIAMLAFMFSPQTHKRKFPLKYYLIFRLGDAGLILAILLAYRCVETFKIKEMLSCAFSGSLPDDILALVLIGATLSAWIKLGLPPFHGWILGSTRLSWNEHAWFAGICLPLLGAYLLGRFGPGWESLGLWKGILPLFGVVILIWLGLHWRGLAYKASPLLIGHGTMALFLVGTIWMDIYLITFIPVRWLFCCWTYARGSSVKQYTGWPDGVASRSTVYNTLLAMAVWVAQTIEQGILERGNRVISSAVLELGQVFQQGHSGRLGRYLLWAVFGGCVIAVLALAMPG